MDPTLVDLIARLTNGSAATLLLFAIIGGYKGWYIFKGPYLKIIGLLEQRYEDMRRDRDGWKDIAMRTLNVTEKVAPVVTASADERSA
jgi:hypothetical protein